MLVSSMVSLTVTQSVLLPLNCHSIPAKWACWPRLPVGGNGPKEAAESLRATMRWSRGFLSLSSLFLQAHGFWNAPPSEGSIGVCRDVRKSLSALPTLFLHICSFQVFEAFLSRIYCFPCPHWGELLEDRCFSSSLTARTPVPEILPAMVLRLKKLWLRG